MSIPRTVGLQAQHALLNTRRHVRELVSDPPWSGPRAASPATFDRAYLQEEIAHLHAAGLTDYAANREYQRDVILPIVERRPVAHADCLRAENDIMRLQNRVRGERTLSKDVRAFRYELLDTALSMVESPHHPVETLWMGVFFVPAYLGALVGQVSRAIPDPAEEDVLQTKDGASLLDPAVCSAEQERARQEPAGPERDQRLDDLAFLSDSVLRWARPWNRRNADLLNNRRFLYEALREVGKASLPAPSKAFRVRAILDVLAGMPRRAV